MNQVEIIKQVIENTDWEMMTELRAVATKCKGYKNILLNNPDELKMFGESLLQTLLIRDTNYVSSGMLTAYRNNHDEDTVEYGVRFEVEATDPTAWVEEGVLMPLELEDEKV